MITARAASPISLSPIAVAKGQCQLQFVSTTQVKLAPLNGRFITIGGEDELLPAAGVILANTGLSAATLYYVYAYMSGAVMSLEASVTGHSIDAATGVEVKTGDRSRTLVGMVYMGAGTPGVFADSVTQRFVASYFNRRGRHGHTITFTVNTTTSGTPVEINPANRLEFLTWGDEISLSTVNGIANNGTTNGMAMTLGFDGTADSPARAQHNSLPAIAQVPLMTKITEALAEGYHFASVFVNSVNAGDTTTVFTMHQEIICVI